MEKGFYMQTIYKSAFLPADSQVTRAWDLTDMPTNMFETVVEFVFIHRFLWAVLVINTSDSALHLFCFSCHFLVCLVFYQPTATIADVKSCHLQVLVLYLVPAPSLRVHHRIKHIHWFWICLQLRMTTFMKWTWTKQPANWESTWKYVPGSIYKYANVHCLAVWNENLGYFSSQVFMAWVTSPQRVYRRFQWKLVSNFSLQLITLLKLCEFKAHNKEVAIQRTDPPRMSWMFGGLEVDPDSVLSLRLEGHWLFESRKQVERHHPTLLGTMFDNFLPHQMRWSVNQDRFHRTQINLWLMKRNMNKHDRSEPSKQKTVYPHQL